MQRLPPPLPPHRPACFRATVHGTVFCNRASHIDELHPGDEVMLIPGPPIEEEPGVWVHSRRGDVIGHLPPEIESWLSRWMLAGGRAVARAIKVHDESVPSWRRLLLEVNCL